MRQKSGPYVPKTVDELWDFLGHMMLSAPTFVDPTGYFPDRNIDTEFFALNEGIRAIRGKLNETAYAQLTALSARMRQHFEADPEDKTEDAIKGRECIHEMEDVLRAIGRRRR